MTTYENAPTVTPLRRPAVHASTLVRSDVTHTFDAFVRTIGAWWPVNRASAGRDRVRNVIFERERGGHVYETWDDGTTIEWGDVTVWEPHTRSMMTWRVTPVPTEVELTFTALGSSLTRVTVEHRGWEAMTDAQLAEDCGAPGGYSTGSFDRGWQQILGAFATAVEEAHIEPTVDITDEFMLENLTRTRSYTLMLLQKGPAWDTPDRDTIIWEHGRRNFALRADGVLAIVCPVPDDSSLCGIGVFDASEEEVARIMDDDPGVRTGVFTSEVHPVRSFPRDALPR